MIQTDIEAYTEEKSEPLIRIEIHGLYVVDSESILDPEVVMEHGVRKALGGASYERDVGIVQMHTTEDELQYNYGPFLYVRGEKDILYTHCEDLQKRLHPLHIGVRFEKIHLYMPAASQSTFKATP
ncbi:MAG TPA: hypothetical protein VJH33_00385 [Candidatus Paceibacterota bacterium]